ncbi:MAG: DUF3558 family protein [Rhodococcus sp.]|nr:DUF3558 family protein [Rhodococcus sp. (in: high G+C Gram-positive bacteria)]
MAACVATLLVGVAFGAAGCGDGENSDTPTTPAEAQPWDPCTLSDEVLLAATLDPATEGPGLSAEPPGWKHCSWDNHDIGAIIGASATAPAEQFRNDPRNFQFQDVVVGGREGFTYLSEIGGEDFCNLVVPFESGGLMNMQVDRSPFTKDETPMCEWAVRVGDGLVAGLPD